MKHAMLIHIFPFYTKFNQFAFFTFQETELSVDNDNCMLLQLTAFTVNLLLLSQCS
jgi:hypothetical protein